MQNLLHFQRMYFPLITHTLPANFSMPVVEKNEFSINLFKLFRTTMLLYRFGEIPTIKLTE